MVWGARTSASQGTVLVLQTPRRSWKRWEHHLTESGWRKKPWLSKAFWKLESRWESGNGREARVLLRGADRVGLPDVCLGGLNSPGRFMPRPLKMEV